MAVKILGICGSYRRGTTYAAMCAALEEAAKFPGVETELFELRGKKINPCIGCNRCIREWKNECLTYPDDDMKVLFEKFAEADGYLIGSPVYSMGITPALLSVFSRFRPNFIVTKENPDVNLFKVGAAVVSGGTRNGGQEKAIDAIHGFYHTKGIPIVNGGLGIYSGAAIWNPNGSTDVDEAGMANARAIGRRLAKAASAMKRGAAAATE